MTDASGPVFRSLAFEDIPAPDYADAFLIPLPATAVRSPQQWAETIFSQQSMPGWVAAGFRFRQVLRKPAGAGKAAARLIPIRKIEAEEALVAFDSDRLHVRCSVGISTNQCLIRVTTAVRFNDRRGRRLFRLLQPIHPLLMNSMIRKAARILAA